MSEVPARILVADDEPGMREGCRRLLVSEGYEVETAPDGKAAFELFNERGDFAAALVDLKMPRTGGIDLVQKLRAADLDVLIVVITAHAAIDTAVEATKRGAFAYVPKPFTPDELLLPLKNGLVNRALAIETRQLRLEREDRLLELAYERSKSGTIIGCMTDGVIVVNGARQVVLLNAAGRHMLAAWSDLRVPAEVRSLCCAEVEELLEQAYLHGQCRPGHRPG